MLERIQKIIAAAGVTSRRAAEELIAEGRVRINGQVVTEPGTKADADKDHIKVDGKLINPQQPKVYVMLNKPAGYVTTMSDPEGRPTVQDLLKGIKIRVYPVGRLDYNTEGMLILTNDGDFAHLITHPKHEFPKTYLAKVKGVLEDSQIDSLEQGIYLDDGKTAPAKLKKVRKEEANSWLEITIHEGRKRQVRRMFDRVGHSVIRLKRIRTGSLTLGSLSEGTFRYLTPAEVTGLREMALRTGTGNHATGVRRQESGGRSLEPGARSQETGGSGRTRVVTGGPKPAHRGGHEDTRPWRAEKNRNEKQRPGTVGRARRLGAKTMQDTREGLRRNQVVKASAPQQRRSPEGWRAVPRSIPRRDTTSHSITSRPAMRTGTGRPSTGAAMEKPEVRRKPDQRPWPSTRKSGPGRKGPRAATDYGQRRDDNSSRPAARSAVSRPATRAGVSRTAPGAFPGRPETRRKPAPRSWPDSGSGRSDSRRKGAEYKGRSEGHRPASGPRPNRSTHTGKGPTRGNRPAGSRGPGQGAGKRGPRR